MSCIGAPRVQIHFCREGGFRRYRRTQKMQLKLIYMPRSLTPLVNLLAVAGARHTRLDSLFHRSTAFASFAPPLVVARSLDRREKSSSAPCKGGGGIPVHSDTFRDR